MLDHSDAFMRIVDEARRKISETNAATVKARLSRGEIFHLIDVREDNEWVKGRIKGAVHMGRGVIERDIEKALPDKNSGIVLYCGGGFRSALAAESLQKMGYLNVLSMDGGWRAWLEAGGEVEK